ncbi:hypothetical protein ACOMHN_043822 [Nucella lapillus]
MHHEEYHHEKTTVSGGGGGDGGAGELEGRAIVQLTPQVGAARAVAGTEGPRDGRGADHVAELEAREVLHILHGSLAAPGPAPAHPGLQVVVVDWITLNLRVCGLRVPREDTGEGVAQVGRQGKTEDKKSIG